MQPGPLSRIEFRAVARAFSHFSAGAPMTGLIPELRTERLRLRAWRIEDFARYEAFSADAEWNRYRHDGLDRVKAWTEFTSVVGQWPLRGYGAWAIDRLEDGAHIGYAGFWHPADIPVPELYWGLYRDAAGRGYATEAARRALDWWRARNGGPLVTYCHPENGPSRRVAERLGAQLSGTVKLRGKECLLFVYPHLHQQSGSKLEKETETCR